MPPTFLDFAGVSIPDNMQGESLRPILNGETPGTWRTSMYYRYWMHCDANHNVYSHYGIRTQEYKLIYYYGKSYGLKGSFEHAITPEWELFDLKQDPFELNNVYHAPAYQSTVQELTRELERLQLKYKDDKIEHTK